MAGDGLVRRVRARGAAASRPAPVPAARGGWALVRLFDPGPRALFGRRAAIAGGQLGAVRAAGRRDRAVRHDAGADDAAAVRLAADAARDRAQDVPAHG